MTNSDSQNIRKNSFFWKITTMTLASLPSQLDTKVGIWETGRLLFPTTIA